MRKMKYYAGVLSSAAPNRGETMDKVSTLGAGIALAVTFALMSAFVPLPS